MEYYKTTLRVIRRFRGGGGSGRGGESDDDDDDDDVVRSEVGGMRPTGKSFRFVSFVRACVRTVWL